MKFQETFLEIPAWDGGIDDRAAKVMEGLEEAEFSTDFPSGITIEDANHALSQLAVQDGNAENLTRVRQIIAKLTPIRSSAILFI